MSVLTNEKAKTAGWLKVDLFLVFCSKCLRDGQCHVNLTIFTLFLQSSSRKILQGVNNLAGHLVNYGKHRTRRSYARIKEVLDLPNLIEIQTNSYQWFLDEGLKEMFDDIMPIDDFQGNCHWNLSAINCWNRNILSRKHANTMRTTPHHCM